MIASYALCGYASSINFNTAKRSNVTSTKISNAIFDDLYVTTNTSLDYSSPIPADWDYNTILKAKYEENLEASNVDFSVGNTNALIIKKRLKGTFNWTTVHVQPVSVPDDFDFIIRDYYCASKRDYEFAIVPVINGIEGRYTTVLVHSEFDGVHVVDKDNIFSAYAKITFSTNKNRPNSTITTWGNKYAYVVSNGQVDYYSGNLSALFAKISDCDFDWENNRDYKDALLDYLNNGCSKILKHEDSRIYMISVVDSCDEGGQEDEDSNANLVSMNWVEIGDVYDNEDLYNNGLSDLGENWYSNILEKEGETTSNAATDVWIDISKANAGNLVSSTMSWKVI